MCLNLRAFSTILVFCLLLGCANQLNSSSDSCDTPSACQVHLVREYIPAKPDLEIDNHPALQFLEQPDVIGYIAVSAMPTKSIFLDYSEHHVELSPNKYYLVLVLGSPKAKPNVEVVVEEIKIIASAASEINLGAGSKDYSIDLVNKNLRRTYFSLAAPTEDFSSISPILSKKGDTRMMSVESYADLSGFEMADAGSNLNISLTLLFLGDGINTRENYKFQMQLKEKQILRNAIRR